MSRVTIYSEKKGGFASGQAIYNSISEQHVYRFYASIFSADYFASMFGGQMRASYQQQSNEVGPVGGVVEPYTVEIFGYKVTLYRYTSEAQSELRESYNKAFTTFTPLGRTVKVLNATMSMSELIRMAQKYEKGDDINLGRFTQKLRNGVLKDPKSREYLEPDRGRNSGGGENGSNHGPSWWKLYSKDGNRIGTISQEGIWLRP